jgi:hypothetical protein
MFNATPEVQRQTFALFLQALGGPLGTVPELLFEKKQLIPDLQRLLIEGCCQTEPCYCREY